MAAPVNTLLQSGKGATASAWSLGRLPASGDTLQIPFGIQYLVEDNINWSDQNLFIRVGGTIFLQNGKLNLGPQSTVLLVDTRAAIQTDKGNAADRITIGGVAKYSGKEGPISGPAYIDSNTASFTYTGQALPVIFSYFSVVADVQGNTLQWATSFEANVHYFEVQRSHDGVRWSALGTRPAAGNSTQPTRYHFADGQPLAGTVYYRLKQVDLDGKFSFSEVRTIQVAGAGQVRITAGGDGAIRVQLPEQAQNPVLVQIVSLSGKILLQQVIAAGQNQALLQAMPAAKGVVIISLSSARGFKAAAQLML